MRPPVADTGTQRHAHLRFTLLLLCSTLPLFLICGLTGGGPGGVFVRAEERSDVFSVCGVGPVVLRVGEGDEVVRNKVVFEVVAPVGGEVERHGGGG